jgi:hypothetical protein
MLAFPVVVQIQWVPSGIAITVTIVTERVTMVCDDLIREAQLLTTGAEIHKTRELIAVYRGAANDPSPQGMQAFTLYQQALEKHVGVLRMKRLRLPA